MKTEDWIYFGIFFILLATAVLYFEYWMKRNKNKYPSLFQYKTLIACCFSIGLELVVVIIRVLS
jgi:hypothetical protein